MKDKIEEIVEKTVMPIVKDHIEKGQVRTFEELEKTITECEEKGLTDTQILKVIKGVIKLVTKG